jgi:hypothetical protein
VSDDLSRAYQRYCVIVFNLVRAKRADKSQLKPLSLSVARRRYRDGRFFPLLHF